MCVNDGDIDPVDDGCKIYVDRKMVSKKLINVHTYIRARTIYIYKDVVTESRKFVRSRRSTSL